MAKKKRSPTGVTRGPNGNLPISVNYGHHRPNGSRDRCSIPRNQRGGTVFLDKILEFQRQVIATATEMLEKGETVVGAEIARIMNSRKSDGEKMVSARMVTNVLSKKKWRKYTAKYSHMITQPARAKRVIMACQIAALIHQKGIEVLKDILFR